MWLDGGCYLLPVMPFSSSIPGMAVQSRPAGVLAVAQPWRCKQTGLSACNQIVRIRPLSLCKLILDREGNKGTDLIPFPSGRSWDLRIE